MPNRICIECGSVNTYLNQRKCPMWHVGKDGDTCHKCYMKNTISPKNNVRRITFKGERIYLEKNPRKGKCKKCQKSIGDETQNNKGEIVRIKQTHMHHKKYDREKPLKHTIELCSFCHNRVGCDSA